MRITLAFPRPAECGWGVASANLPQAMSALADVEVEYDQGADRKVDGVVMQALTGNGLDPWAPKLVGDVNVAYVFFEADLFVQSRLHLLDRYDWVFCGSTWCAERLRQFGYGRTSFAPQGVDCSMFVKGVARPESKPFVVLSAGKFEYRKAQEVVLNVFARFHSRHPESLLVGLWYNPWPELVHLPGGNFEHKITSYLQHLALPNRAVRFQSRPLPQSDISTMMRACDIAVFPNRCEGGNNLMLMEAMACAVPCIAGAWTGHSDIADGLWRTLTPSHMLRYCVDGVPVQEWPEPDEEDVLCQLEYSYDNRFRLDEAGFESRKFVKQWSWDRSAKAFIDVLEAMH